MRHQFANDNTKLIITVSAEEKAELNESIRDAEFPDSESFMYDVFESLIGNTELQWIDPSQTGDLTEAPMLGIMDENDKVISRWAFMDYQLRSPIRDLADNGLVVFVGGN